MPQHPATEELNADGPEQVQCSHLLVKHEKSRRPSSWREERITRSKNEAIDIIKGEYICNLFKYFINKMVHLLLNDSLSRTNCYRQSDIC